MAAVLRQQRRDEARLPDRPEARRLAYRGKTGIGGVDEERPLRAVDADVVDVELAGDTAFARHEFTGGAGLRRATGGEPVDEAPQDRLAAHPQRVAVGPQPLAMLDQPLMRADR